MVDDDLVATIRSEGCLDGLGYCSACFYIPYHSTVFGLVAAIVLVRFFCWWDWPEILLVALLEETAIRRAGHRKRHYGVDNSEKERNVEAARRVYSVCRWIRVQFVMVLTPLYPMDWYGSIFRGSALLSKNRELLKTTRFLTPQLPNRAQIRPN